MNVHKDSNSAFAILFASQLKVSRGHTAWPSHGGLLLNQSFH